MTAPSTDMSSFGLDNNSDTLSGFYQPGQIGSYSDTANGTLGFGMNNPNSAIDYSSSPGGAGSSGAPASSGGESGFDFSGYLPDWNNPQGKVTPGQPVTPGTPAATAPATTPATTPAAAPASSGAPASATGSNTGYDWLDNIINGLTGGKGLASSLGSMAPYLADFALAQKMADKTQAANTKTIQPLYDQAKLYLDAAAKELNLYEHGAITPAQQIELDRNAASHKAQIAQFYSSNGIQNSSMMQTQMQQVDDSGVIMKQAFVDDSLKKALALEGAGITPLLTAVQDKLISDTELSKTMMELMGNLAKAWAYQTAQGADNSGGGGGGGSAAGGGAAGSIIKDGIKWVKDKAGNWIKDLFGGGSSAPDLIGAGGGTITDIAGADLGGLSGLDMGINLGSSAAAGGGGTAAAAGAGSGLLPGSIPGASLADTAAYNPAMIEATTPGAGMSTLAGLGIGAAAFAAWYGAARLLAGTGHRSDADWVKVYDGHYATAMDAFNAAMKSGNTDEAFKQSGAASQSAWQAAVHYAGMGDQANAAKYLAIYKQMTANGSWYNTQLVARSGGATHGQNGSRGSKVL